MNCLADNLNGLNNLMVMVCDMIYFSLQQILFKCIFTIYNLVIYRYIHYTDRLLKQM